MAYLCRGAKERAFLRVLKDRGNLAKFAAMRRASSRVSLLVAERRCGSVVEMEIAEQSVSIFLSKKICPPFDARYSTLGIALVFAYALFRAKVL